MLPIQTVRLWSRPLSFVLVLLLGVATSMAAEVWIEGDQPSERLTIQIKDASVDDVLVELATKFGFEVVNGEQSASESTWSTTMTGDLETIIARLLRNRNHSIVRAPGTSGRIRRIIFLNPDLADDGPDITDSEQSTGINSE